MLVVIIKLLLLSLLQYSDLVLLCFFPVQLGYTLDEIVAVICGYHIRCLSIAKLKCYSLNLLWQSALCSIQLCLAVLTAA